MGHLDADVSSFGDLHLLRVGRRVAAETKVLKAIALKQSLNTGEEFLVKTLARAELVLIGAPLVVDPSEGLGADGVAVEINSLVVHADGLQGTSKVHEALVLVHSRVSVNEGHAVAIALIVAFGQTGEGIKEFGQLGVGADSVVSLLEGGDGPNGVGVVHD